MELGDSDRIGVGKGGFGDSTKQVKRVSEEFSVSAKNSKKGKRWEITLRVCEKRVETLKKNS